MTLERSRRGDRVARRGETLELAVLGLLHESPMHGYELRKQVNGVLGWSRLLSYGSLYPALKRMLRAGWIAEHVTDPEPGAVRHDAPPVNPPQKALEQQSKAQKEQLERQQEKLG